MILIPIAAALLFVIGVWCVISSGISLSQKNARLCRGVLLMISVLGAVGALAAVVIYNVLKSSERVSFARESFNAFALSYIVFIGIGFFVTLLSSLLKSKMRPVIFFVLPMWAFIGLFASFVGAVWLSYSDTLAALYASVFGVCGGAILAFPAFLEMCERVRILLDDNKREEIIRGRREKRQRRERVKAERKRIAEKKKKLKNPKK